MEKANVTNMQTTSNLPAKAEDIETMPSMEVDMYKMEITAQQIRQYIAPPDATPADIGFFLALSKSLGLNPFANEVYMIPFKGKQGRKYAPVVSYQVMLDRADQSGVWDGMEIEFDDDENPTKCTVLIYRKDWTRPGKRTTLLSEVIRTRWDKDSNKRVPMALWATNLRQMFEKCSVIAALRFFIPACRRMPYIEAEVMSPNGYIEPQRISAHITGAEAVNVDADIDYLRGQFFKYGSLVFGKDEDARHKWQEENIGKASLTDWTADDFNKALDLLDDLQQASAGNDVPFYDSDEDAPESDTDPDSGAEPEEEDRTDTAGDTELDIETEEQTFDQKIAQIIEMVMETPWNTIDSVPFRSFASKVVDADVIHLSDLSESALDALINELHVLIDADADKKAEEQGELL